MSTRMAGFPGPDASRMPISTTMPSAMSSATRSETVTRVSPVSARQVGAAHRAAVEQRLQHERAVVAAGVLGQDLAALTQRTARAERVTVRRRGEPSR